MAKYIICIICVQFLTLQTNYSQNYEVNFKADICKCLEVKVQGRNTVTNLFQECFREKLTSYAINIDNSILEENNLLKYQKGQQLRRELSDKFQYELVYSCDVYFDMLEAEKERKYAADRANTYQDDLDRINQQLAMHPHSQMYLQRAKVYFNLSKLKEAEQDILQSIKINPLGEEKILHIAKEKVLLAKIFEKQKNYNRSAAIYQEIYTAIPNVEVAKLHALVHKKAGAATTSLVPHKIINNTAQNTTETSSREKPNTRSILGLDKGNQNKPVQENDRVSRRKQAKEQYRKKSQEQSTKSAVTKKDETTEKAKIKKLFNYRKN